MTTRAVVLPVWTRPIRPRVLVIGPDPYRTEPELLEQMVNRVRRHAPDAAIAFNATPQDTFEAAARWVDVPG